MSKNGKHRPKGKNSNAKKSQSKPQPPIYIQPPTYSAQSVRRWKVRMDVAANAAAQTMTSGHLSQVLGIVATSATTSTFLSDSFRLRRCSMWSWTGTAGTTVDIMLKYVDSGNGAGQAGPPCVRMDSSASMDRPAYVSIKPPRTSAQNLWHDCTTAGTNFLTYYSPQTAIMDLDFEFIVDDLGAPTAGPTLVSAVAGTIYHHSVLTLSVVNPLNRI